MYILDGYNIAWLTEFRNVKSREKMRENLINYAKRIGKKILIVFDGFQSVYNIHNYNSEKVEVVFSKFLSADDYIFNFVKNEKNTHNITVVTSDSELRNKVKSLGVKVIGPKEFINMHKKEVHGSLLTQEDLEEIKKELKNRKNIGG